MATVKLTLSVQKESVGRAKAFARESGTSISKLVSRFLAGLSSPRDARSIGPVTRRLRGVVRLPENKSDRALIEESLIERYRR